jgi:hypothetical protein
MLTCPRHSCITGASEGPRSPILYMLNAACESANAGTEVWSVDPPSDPSEAWIRVRCNCAEKPEQGWKLHISATAYSAETVLQRVLPVLLGENADFKVARSTDTLDSFNEGHAGLSQIGKFITVYPSSDNHAVRLAVALDEATRGLRGPAVPSDNVMKPGGIVYYRYGGFSDQHLQTRLGEILPAICTPDGKHLPDLRLPYYSAPHWAVDPFVAAGVTREPRPSNALVAHRYLVICTLHSGPRGAVHLAIDVETPRRCVLKQALCDALVDSDGCDARDRLRREAEILVHLSPDVHFPAVFDMVEEEGDLFLVMEDIEGQTLEEYVAGLATRGKCVPMTQVIAWGQELVAILQTIHAKGFIYRDLKSSNVVVAPDKGLRLVDFELAHAIGDHNAPYGRGTLGYMSCQQFDRQCPSISDDIYGLGALLYFASTGAEPSQAPRPFALLERPPAMFNVAMIPALQDVIARCLEQDQAKRFPSMEALGTHLAAIDTASTVVSRRFGDEVATVSDENMSAQFRRLARRLGDSLCAAARCALNSEGLAWVSTHAGSSGLLARDVAIGCAGTLLALASLVAEIHDQEHRRVLAEGLRWLAKSMPGQDPLPGLYVGEAGVGAALLRGGQVLNDRQLVALAAERSRWVATLPYASPDIYNGTAGRLRFHLLLWDETADSEHLRYAEEAGENLLIAAEDAGNGGLRWTIPPGYEGMSGSTYLGYAHGAAGIGDVLLDLFEATNDERFLATARGTGHWLARLGVPALDDDSGLNWPAEEGEAPFAPMWCHGAAGIGQFFLHGAQFGLIPEAADLAARAACTVAWGTRWASPIQCHGLAGNIEFLLDMFQSTADRAYLVEACSLARLLAAWAVEQDGLLVFPSEERETITPDYMVGYGGVATCLLRLSDPTGLPRQLSRRGFCQGRCAGPNNSRHGKDHIRKHVASGRVSQR